MNNTFAFRKISLSILSAEEAVQCRLLWRRLPHALFIFGLGSTIRPNTNSLFGPLFGAEANTKRIFGTALVLTMYVSVNTTQYITASAQKYYVTVNTHKQTSSSTAWWNAIQPSGGTDLNHGFMVIKFSEKLDITCEKLLFCENCKCLSLWFF